MSLPDFFDEAKFLERVYLDPIAIEEELAKNPSWMAYYSAQANRWEAIADRKKLQRDARKGQITKDFEANGKKATVARVEAEHQTDELVLQYSKEYITAKEQANQFKMAHSNLDTKQYSLTTISGRQKLEMERNKPSSFVSSLSDEERAERRKSILDAQR